MGVVVAAQGHIGDRIEPATLCAVVAASSDAATAASGDDFRRDATAILATAGAFVRRIGGGAVAAVSAQALRPRPLVT